MASCLLLEQQIEIPLTQSLAEFRAWALSDQFPEQGRIDYVAGRIEVDMSPEDIFFHGSLKTEVVGRLWQVLKRRRSGHLFSDRTRISSVPADLSSEPDVVYVSDGAIDTGRVRLVPKASGEPDRFVEIEGPPELVVEIVSDTSVQKDTRRLPPAYFRAGVDEFWFIDARGEPLVFQVHRRGASAFEPVPPDAAGFQHSRVFDASFRLVRWRNPSGRWVYDLEERTPAEV